MAGVWVFYLIGRDYYYCFHSDTQRDLFGAFPYLISFHVTTTTYVGIFMIISRRFSKKALENSKIAGDSGILFTLS